MRIHLPEQVTGARDMLFVLDVQVPPTSAERKLEVKTQGPLEALDLRGTGPGGTYLIPAGQDQIHVPLRVTADGAGEATVELKCTAGPEAGRSERRTVRLTAPAAAAAAGGRSGVLLPLLAVAALVVGGIVLWPKLMGGDKVPAVVGKKHRDAVKAAQAAKLRVKLDERDVDDESKDGVVLSQDPAAGTSAKEDAELTLVVGRYAAPMVEVPDLVGDTVANAESALRALGFQPLVTFKPAPSADKVGKVLSQTPSGGARLDRDREVELHVGRLDGTTPQPGPGDPDGPTTTPVPVVPPPVVPEPPTVPMPPDPSNVPAPPGPPDPSPVVPTPPPGPGPSTQGSRTVPDVKGKSKADAEWALANVGLLVEFRESAADAAMAGKVISQTPAPGSTLEPLGTVVLTVGRTGSPAQPTDPQPVVPPVEPVKPPTPPVEPPMPPDPGPRPTDPPPVQPPPVEPPPVQPPPAAAGKVPDTIGLMREAAEGLVRAAGYRSEVSLKSTHDLEDGRVLGQQPAPGEPLSPGGAVLLEVARTPLPGAITVADVRGMDATAAAKLLRDQGLVVRETAGGGAQGDQGKVVDQAPAAGSEVASRSWVEIVVARSLGTSPRAVGGPPPASSGLNQPPAVGPGPMQPRVATPRASVTPLAPVQLPSRDSPPTISVPSVGGQNARAAIDTLLRAGLMPIVDVDRHAMPVGNVVSQGTDAGQMVRAGDLVRIKVALGSAGGERFVNIPIASGAELAKAEQMFQRMGLGVEVVEVSVPGHPYAGTGRVAAQFPVSTVGMSQARTITLWLVR